MYELGVFTKPEYLRR